MPQAGRSCQLRLLLSADAGGAHTRKLQLLQVWPGGQVCQAGPAIQLLQGDGGAGLGWVGLMMSGQQAGRWQNNMRPRLGGHGI